MKHLSVGIAVCSAVLSANAARAADAATSWEGLVRVHSTNLDQVYLQPDARFDRYTKVILAPVEVEFAKNWLEKYNGAALFATARVSEGQLQQTIRDAVLAGGDLFASAWTKGGYSVVQSVGPDVMQVRTGVINISVTAPQTAAAGRMHSFSREAGRATFFVEVRDSVTGSLLGRVVDEKLIGDDLNTWRTQTTNRADFRRQVEHWAELTVRGVNELKANSKRFR